MLFFFQCEIETLWIWSISLKKAVVNHRKLLPFAWSLQKFSVESNQYFNGRFSNILKALQILCLPCAEELENGKRWNKCKNVRKWEYDRKKKPEKIKVFSWACIMIHSKLVYSRKRKKNSYHTIKLCGKHRFLSDYRR